jgi:hypothetical protein
MKRTWTIIGVGDVAGSLKWYQSLFGQPETSPAHPDFGQILDSDGTVLLCLHEWGAHGHPSLMSPEQATPGNGLILFFRVREFARRCVRSNTPHPEFPNWARLSAFLFCASSTKRISSASVAKVCGDWIKPAHTRIIAACCIVTC